MNLVSAIEIFAYVVIFVGGMIANILVLRGTCVLQAKKTPALFNTQNECKNLLIMNLAAADLIILIVSLPTDVITSYVGWPFGEFTCKFISPIQDVAMSASALTFAALAVERYLVAKGTSQRSFKNGKRVIFVIWLASWLTLGIPLAKFKKIVEDEGKKECELNWPNIYVARFFFAYIIVLVVGCGLTGAICYCSIRRYLTRLHKHYPKDSPNGSSDSFAEQTHKVSTMLCVLVTTFVICVLPLPIIGVFVETEVLTDPKVIYPVYIGTSCLLYGNCLANPIIVLLMSRECRTALTTVRVLPKKVNENKPIALMPL